MIRRLCVAVDYASPFVWWYVLITSPSIGQACWALLGLMSGGVLFCIRAAGWYLDA